MSYTEFISNCISLCRICLTRTSNMHSFEDKYNPSEDSLTIIELLEKTLGNELNSDARYPRNVCYTCIDSIECSVDIRDIFRLSQNILGNYVSLAPIASETIKAAENSEETSSSKQSLKVGTQTNERKDSKVRIQTNEGKNISRCHYCSQKFETEDSLKTHYIECKKVIRVKCDYCDKIMISREILNSHLRLKHQKEIGLKPQEYKCDECEEVFNSANTRSYHKTTKHYSKGEIFPCELCGKSFMFKNSLRQHMQSHNKDTSRVICPICGKSFQYSGGLFYHMKMHANERDYVCSICDHKFLNLSALKKHSLKHTNERLHLCTYCPKSFFSKTEVETHERRHLGDKSHPCKYCDKKFITPWGSRLHMSTHPGSYQCEICSMGLLNEHVLELHYHFKHNTSVEISKADE